MGVSSISNQQNACLELTTSSFANSAKIEEFFAKFEEILAKNDVVSAKKIAGRMKHQLFTIETSNKESPLLHTLAVFHKKVVDILDKSATPAAAAMRQELCPFYFQPASKNGAMHWLSEQEIQEKGSSKHANAFYYHATKLAGLEGILSTGDLLARQAVLYGAFCKMQEPNFEYGPYVLAFNKSIERKRPVSTFIGHDHGVGFLKNIQQNCETVNHIIIQDEDYYHLRQDIIKQFGPAANIKTHANQYRDWIAAKCKEWSGREIPVLLQSESKPHQEKVMSMQLGIPIEWGAGNYSDLYFSEKPKMSRSAFLPSKL